MENKTEKRKKTTLLPAGVSISLIILGLILGDVAVLGNLVIISVLISIVPYFLYKYSKFMWLKGIEEQFPNFVRDLADSARSGMSFSEAVSIASKANYGKLSVEVEKMKNECLKKFGKIDILVNNAGVFLDKKDPYAFGGEFISFFDTNLDVVKKTMETNLYGPFLLYQAVVPFMKKNRYGRIVNMSSGLGQLAKMGSGYTAYRLSKAALNALTCILASESKDDNILVNSVNPGWVRTDMGGPMAPRDVAEGVDTVVWLAMLPEDWPTGKFFRDRTEIMW